jgi:3-hydroxyisobutyrate dehydrogenase
MSEKKRVGIIGVGFMGHGIAKNVLKHGHALKFLNHPGNQPVDDLIAAGATRTDSAAILAAASDVIILCVTGSPQVEDAVFRQDGVLGGLKRGAVVLDCTTAIPTSTDKVSKAVQAAGARYLDTAMTRTSKEAEEGRIGLIVGGDDALFKEMEPLLRCFAESITHAGPIGSGHKLKLLHNFVSLGFAALLAEAAACAARSGVEAGVFLDVLEKGAGDGVVFKRLKPFIQSGDPSGLRFTIVNALKDLGYYNTMAGDAAAPHEIAEAVRHTYDAATQGGHGQQLVPELVAVLTKSE